MQRRRHTKLLCDIALSSYVIRVFVVFFYIACVSCEWYLFPWAVSHKQAKAESVAVATPEETEAIPTAQAEEAALTPEEEVEEETEPV